MSEQMYRKCRLSRNVKLQKCDVKSVIGVGGKVTQVLGEIIAPLTIAGLNLFQNFLVIPGSSAPEIILGENFLYKQRATIDFSQGNVSLQGGMVTVGLENPKSKQEKVCFVKTMHDVTVSAESECLLPVKIGKSKTSKNDVCFQDTDFGLINPTVSLPKQWRVAGPRCAVSPSSNNCVYRLLNPYPNDTHIPKGTIIGTFTPIKDATTSLMHMADLPPQFTMETSSHSDLNPNAPEFVPSTSQCVMCQY